MVPVQIALVVSDACTNPEDLIMTGEISCNEPDDGYGDGSFAGDVDLLDGQGGQDAFVQSLPLSLVYDPVDHVFRAIVDLRAERNPRRYGSEVLNQLRHSDASGNLGTAACVVVVPHDKRKN